MSNRKNISYKFNHSDTYEQDLAWLDKLTVWATIILLGWFLFFVGYKVIEAALAGRL